MSFKLKLEAFGYDLLLTYSNDYLILRETVLKVLRTYIGGRYQKQASNRKR